ncbi:MAG: hypothetical protein ACHP6H_00080 [Legionellales bacterium]
MKLASRISIIALILCNTGSALADDMADLKKYFTYFGGYLGYDVTANPVTKQNPEVIQTLINKKAIDSVERYLVSTLLGAIPVNAINASLAQFVSNSDSPINGYANATFTNPAFNEAKPGNISVNALVDQQTYQNDPVSQSLLNILVSPDFSDCFDYTGTPTSNWANGKCPLLTQYQIITGVIGMPPSPSSSTNSQSGTAASYFSYEYNKPFLSQLNSNTLLAPLMYSTTTIAPGPQAETGKGLMGQSQAEAALNFVRYASASVAPLSMPKFKDYSDTYNLAYNTALSATNGTDIVQAQTTLASYFTGLRIYAAQSSVGIGNLYYILSKRIEQQPKNAQANSSSESEGTAQPTSEALNEFNMATWRFTKPSGSDKDAQSWVSKINTASSATVQKEIAILLAEINYQMYLTRQQEERMLLTNTMLLFQNGKTAQPAAFGSPTGQFKPDTTTGTPGG